MDHRITIEPDAWESAITPICTKDVDIEKTEIELYMTMKDYGYSDGDIADLLSTDSCRSDEKEKFMSLLCREEEKLVLANGGYYYEDRICDRETDFVENEIVFVVNELERDLHGFGKVLIPVHVDQTDQILLVQVNDSGENQETADNVYKLAEGLVCSKCHCPACVEHNIPRYPFYCPSCDENLYEFETKSVDSQTYTALLELAVEQFREAAYESLK